MTVNASTLADRLWDFVADLPADLREGAMAWFLRDLERLYAEHGQPTPAFVHIARERLLTRAAA